MAINKFNTNLDLSRQAEIFTGETACFDGGMQMGIPFSGFASGVDLSTVVSLGGIVVESATFSGTSATTVFDVTNLTSPVYDSSHSDLRNSPYTTLLVSTGTSGSSTNYNPLLTYTANTGLSNDPTSLVWGNGLIEKVYDVNNTGTTTPNNYFTQLFDTIGTAIVGNTILLSDAEYYQTDNNSIFSGLTFDMEIITQGVHGGNPSLVTGVTSGSVVDYTGTTFTWSNATIINETSGLTLPITALSSDTQSSDYQWTLSQSTIIDGNLIGLQYTGFNVTYTFESVADFGTGVTEEYYGVVSATKENFSADTLDYKGDLNWMKIKGNASIDQKLTTDTLTVLSGAQVDYILKSDGAGNLSYTPFSGFAATGCTDVTTNNIFPCTTGGTITIHGNLIVSGTTSATTTIIETEIIKAEDNNIELNYGGNHTTAIGGGITVLSGVSNSDDSSFYTHTDGTWIAYPGLSASTISACTSIYTSNLYGCSPITVHSNLQNVTSTATGNYVNVFGTTNTVTSNYSSILGGKGSTITGGTVSASQPSNTIVGGYSHSIFGSNWSFIGGGYNNQIEGSTPSTFYSNSIVGGLNNVITGNKSKLSSIVGGGQNRIDDSVGSTIVGGGIYIAVPTPGIYSNYIQDFNHSFIGGGYKNRLIGGTINQYSVIGGGSGNTISGVGNGDASNSVIGGGRVNTITASTDSSIIGGFNNTVIHDNAHIIGSNLTSLVADTTHVENLYASTAIGVGKTAEFSLDILDSDGRFYFDGGGGTGPFASISGGTDEINRLIVTDGTTGISIGTRGGNETANGGFGNPNDSFVIAGAATNGFNLINSDGAADDYIRFYAGIGGDVSATTADIHIQGANSGGSLRGFVGVNVETPLAQLHVSGDTGDDQFLLGTSFTPSSSGDTAGNIGSVAWDDNYFYQKTNTGWGRLNWDYGF